MHELPASLREYQTDLDAFIEREIRPLEQQDDNKRFFDHRRENERTDWAHDGRPHPAWVALIDEARRRADRAGHYRYGLPAAWGGRDGSNLELAVIREHLNAKGLGLHNDAASEHSVVANARLLPAQLLIEYGTQAQQQELLPTLLDQGHVLAMAITEPRHGSDATHMETTARRDGSDWIIDGEKTWNSGVDAATHNIVFARTFGKPGDAKGITAFIVPLNPTPAPGMSVVGYLWTFNMPTDHAHVKLENVRVPADAMLGEEGEGLAIAQHFFNENRIRQAAASLGAAQYCIDESVAHAKQRMPFGKPLAANQAIQFPLAELHTQCEMVRALLHKTAALMDEHGAGSQGQRVSMLNFWANRLCCETADRAMQVHGGMGWSRHKPFEHIYRHHRRYRITEGTEEMQLRRVAGFLFGHMR